MMVDLPEPEAPTKAMNSPGSMVRLTSLMIQGPSSPYLKWM
jgi:hypothetical protein